jgi:hypothetical protein
MLMAGGVSSLDAAGDVEQEGLVCSVRRRGALNAADAAGMGVVPGFGEGRLQLSSHQRAGQLAAPHGEGPGAPGGQVQLAGVLQVSQEVRFEFGDHAGVAEGDVELVIKRERAVVEVDRSDRDPVGVHHKTLAWSMVRWYSKIRPPQASSCS